MNVRSLGVLSIALLTSCAGGGEDEQDGVIIRADAGEDDGAERTDGATTDEDTGADDTGADDDTGAPDEDASPADTGGSEDTGAPDTGPTCPAEEIEPNDTPATARSFGTIDDCDGSGKTATGVLSSSADVDMFTFKGTDSFGCSVNPTVKVTGPARACIGATCNSGTTEINSCPKGTKTGDECCGSEAEIALNCTGTTSDDAKIVITVRGDSSTPTCAEYSISFHY